ncbi:MAG: tRNA (N6-isopentenyl adenosine(37)-C2)-methylthiotransferase MiaB [Desulfatitalea sp.]|nr:tRNA (N6-isopentenyl adenosine(37)-C2)-methylthiotransferase MiaB [Desulfatitalea sp.]NNK00764.1 tRNA (N6-isopentenyl adenosine(37)-C2)-methylthiotransferase MiaB [Desulfatitalea sp.]
MQNRRVFINTMGCQMNVYDTGQILHRLARVGYAPTDTLSEADLIIVNTCAIRDKAEQKAFSFLGRLASLKKQNPELIIGIGGCVAQQEGRKILSRMPYVDVVFGTHAIGRLPQIIQRIAATRCRVVDVALAPAVSPDDFILGPAGVSEAGAFVTIMRGCDNYCTYCVVPHVRGRESSRPPDEILDEIRHRVAQGIREVTLLGQNVNSYGQKEGVGTFHQLLARVNEIEGLQRIRFTTSHPKDLSTDLMKAFARLEKLCPHIHLPVQSGADAVLKRMNRGYTNAQYLEKVDRLRQVRPDIALTSDIIVGFPGETEADFGATLDLIHRVAYDGLFVFSYSDRPNAPAARFKGKIEETVKKSRLQKVLACQEVITTQKNKTLEGRVEHVLVDGPSKHLGDASGIEPGMHAHDPGSQTPGGTQWSGRTATNKIVHFKADHHSAYPNQILTGRTLPIMIERAMPHSLWGRIVSHPDGASGKGETIYAA